MHVQRGSTCFIQDSPYQDSRYKQKTFPTKKIPITFQSKSEKRNHALKQEEGKKKKPRFKLTKFRQSTPNHWMVKNCILKTENGNFLHETGVTIWHKILETLHCACNCSHFCSTNQTGSLKKIFLKFSHLQNQVSDSWAKAPLHFFHREITAPRTHLPHLFEYNEKQTKAWI